MSNALVSRSIPQISTDPAADLMAMEYLPLSLRDAIREANQQISAQSVLSVWQIYGIPRMLDMICNRELDDIISFGAYYQKQTGYPYPSLEADASILRYNSNKRPYKRRRQRWYDADNMRVQ